jgi:uncharacterized protein (TIGR02300 family)
VALAIHTWQFIIFLSTEVNLVKPEWGEKRICLDCGAKFYDMQRSPIVCPSCETVFVPVVATRSSRAKAPAPKPKPKLVKSAVADEDAALVTDDDDEEISDDPVLETLGDDDDDDDDLIEDASDLGGTDNVLEGLDGGPEKPDNPATS